MSRISILFAGLLLTSIFSCAPAKPVSPIIGTWQLVSATATVHDSTYSTFNPKTSFIKIINGDHFAFFNHDLQQGMDSATRVSYGGGGKYELVDSNYTEHLEYFNDRSFENTQYHFVMSFSGDTLIQHGIEKDEAHHIDHYIVEKYKRMTN